METIMNVLSDNELAGLHAKFVVPVAVSRILNRLEPLDDVAEYMMHDMIGSLKPDTALLAIALCAQHVAAHSTHLPIGRMLAVESARIVDEYGPLWLKSERGGRKAHDIDVEPAHTAEDLESLGDLLLTTCGELGNGHENVATLCDILGSEAHMHHEEAQAQLDSLYIPENDAAHNVVMFPCGSPQKFTM
jgi:hypothetical protein